MNNKKINKKAKELKKFKPDEVSLVTAGANKKTAFIIKNENGEIGMPSQEEELIKKLETFEFADEAKTVESIEAIAKSNNLDDSQKAALKSVLAIMESSGMEASGFSVTFDPECGYSSVSIYKEEELVPEESVEAAVENPEPEKPEVTDESGDTITDLEDKIEKLSALIEDKVEVEKILKGEVVHVVELPAHIQKQLDDQADELAIIRKERDDQILLVKKAEEEMIVKSFKEDADSSMKYLGEAGVVGDLMLKCSRSLSDEDYNSLKNILKNSNVKIEKSKMFTEVGESTTVEDEAQGEERVQKEAQTVAEAEGVSIEKARVIVRERLAKASKQTK